MRLKITLLFLLIFFSISSINLNAQDNSDIKYRRSSLTMILLDVPDTDSIVEHNTLKEIENLLYAELETNFGDVSTLKQEIHASLYEKTKEDNVDVSGIKEMAVNSWNAYPFPDKYDRHNIGTTGFSLVDKSITLTDKNQQEISSLETKIKTKQNLIVSTEEKRLNAVKKLAKKISTPKKFAKALQNIDKLYGEQLKTYRLNIEEHEEEIKNIKVGGVRSTIFTAMKDQKKDTKLIQPKIENQFSEQRIAHQLVRRWFSGENGKMFDMSTIQKRGLYDASMLDFNVARKEARGMALLADAGEELIGNTFVTVVDLDFFSNKPIADMLRVIAQQVDNVTSNIGGGLFGGIAGLVGSAAKLSMNAAAAGIEDGYTVFSKTFLYKLKWNEEIAANFYNIWGDEAAFENMNFELEFVGVQYEKSRINAGVFSKREDRKMENVVKRLVVRNLDENFANLQKKYDVFKPKVPILSNKPLTAQIGKKEGLNGGEKFEILEMRQDPDTGRTKWVKVATTSVDKKFVWDNRYNVGEEDDQRVVEGEDKQPISATTFKDDARAQIGMFLRQIK